MTKAIVIIKKRDDMAFEDFTNYWLERHGPKATQIPGLRSYVQNHVGTLADQGPRPCDGIEELEFESPEALQTALASDQARDALEDLENFSDMSRTGLIYVEQVPVSLGG